MEQFTASNGVIVRVHDTEIGQRISARDEEPAEVWGYTRQSQETYLDPRQHEALHEFFQHERDEELGRWRWPENPDYVVYQDTPGGVLVFREQRPVGSVLYRRGDVVVDMESEAARAYFEAHPERKPWEDAEPGDVWVLTLEGDESAWTMGGKGKFEDPESTLKPDSPMITAGRRIWPVSDD